MQKSGFTTYPVASAWVMSFSKQLSTKIIFLELSQVFLKFNGAFKPSLPYIFMSLFFYLQLAVSSKMGGGRMGGIIKGSTYFYSFMSQSKTCFLEKLVLKTNSFIHFYFEFSGAFLSLPVCPWINKWASETLFCSHKAAKRC